LADRPDLLAIWDEAEAGLTAEAQFLKAMDRADMRIQAGIYGAEGIDVREFLGGT
jgi:hypothetical protein